ncbi:MAG TPA: hypothetical protein VF665_11345 [Longimicrobium sp.]|uniref:hypothetical protein n=1 Tax=Longimicrobium sp. TaxID=2029185 RepID=UPI002ED77486
MLIPRYWARAETHTTTGLGKAVHLRAWRGSRTSQAEAQAAADEALQRMTDRVRRGEPFPERYIYGDRPLREEVVRELPEGAGAEGPDVAITRNAYGALVMNAARAFFIDVDIASEPDPYRGPATASGPSPLWGLINALPVPPALRSILEGILGPSTAAEPAPAPASSDPTAPALGRLRTWMASHPDWRVRVYRTHAGLRYLVTHAAFRPEDAEVQTAMAAVGADPQYIKLCRAQKSFRARLTPKPWRIDVPNPPVRFPYVDAGDEAAMKEWQADYTRASQGRATCKFLQELGGGSEHPDITAVRELHDDLTRATSGLPLA